MNAPQSEAASPSVGNPAALLAHFPPHAHTVTLPRELNQRDYSVEEEKRMALHGLDENADMKDKLKLVPHPEPVISAKKPA